MATPFQDFVNTELPKRINSDQDPTSIPAGYIPVSTGVGLQTQLQLLPVLGSEPADGDLANEEYAVWYDSNAGEINIKLKDSSGVVKNQAIGSGDFIPTSQKGAAGGVAELDDNAQLLANQIPALAITNVFVIDNTANDPHDGLLTSQTSAEEGDVAIINNGDGNSKSYILGANDPTVEANWKELKQPTDVVTSINGQTGDVWVAPSPIQGLIEVVDAREYLVGMANPFRFKLLKITAETGAGTVDIDVKINTTVVATHSASTVRSSTDLSALAGNEGANGDDVSIELKNLANTPTDLSFSIQLQKLPPA
ncbi:MAG: hypothetical protein ACQETE_01555 [Bacteroidota bacterium]